MTNIQSDDNEPQIFSHETEEVFEEKIHGIDVRQKEDATQQTAADRHMPYRNLIAFPIAHDVLGLVSEDDAVRCESIPFYRDEHKLLVGITERDMPGRDELLAQLAETTKHAVVPYLISQTSFEHAHALYKTLPHVRPVKRGVSITPSDITRFQGTIKGLASLQEHIARITTTELVTMLVAAALHVQATDIHVEAEEGDIVIRFRIDGVLHTAAHLEKQQWQELASRVKLLAKLKLNIVDRPQDGSFQIALADDKIDVRVSALPTAYGESFVLRILRSSSTGLQFDDLGIRGKSYEQLLAQVKRPNGMILTTGPTGSGKTTTLYAVLNLLNTPDTKIITLEDPVEYKLAGVNQSQVDPTKNYTFALGLKAALRQDPDVMMVGEIRDLETAETAINAALTGHLVLSTLHTNSAAASIPRLLALGAKSFLMAPAINALVGQRLVRRLCESCKRPAVLDEQTMKRIHDALQNVPGEAGSKLDLEHLEFFTASGCEKCQDIGYTGRTGIYEILINTPEMQKLILAETVIEHDIETLAREQGMITMAQDGLLKALDGITSVDEVFRVIE